MKLVLAFIQPFKLEAVTHALEQIPRFPGMTVSDSRGFGRMKVDLPQHSQEEELEDFDDKVRIETIVHDDQVENVLSVIAWTAHTGRYGDGMIFVVPVERALRIMSFREGEGAI